MSSLNKCDICKKIFSHRSNLSRHKKTCKKKKLYMNDIPTFNGSDFLDGNPTKETIEKLKKTCKENKLYVNDIPTFNGSDGFSIVIHQRKQ